MKCHYRLHFQKNTAREQRQPYPCVCRAGKREPKVLGNREDLLPQKFGKSLRTELLHAASSLSEDRCQLLACPTCPRILLKRMRLRNHAGRLKGKRGSAPPKTQPTTESHRFGAPFQSSVRHEHGGFLRAEEPRLVPPGPPRAAGPRSARSAPLPADTAPLRTRREERRLWGSRCREMNPDPPPALGAPQPPALPSPARRSLSAIFPEAAAAALTPQLSPLTPDAEAAGGHL